MSDKIKSKDLNYQETNGPYNALLLGNLLIAGTSKIICVLKYVELKKSKWL